MDFSRQDYWSGLPFPSTGDLPNPRIEPRSLALQEDSLPFELPGKPNPIGLFLIPSNSHVMPYKNKWHSYGIKSVCHWLTVVGTMLSLHMYWVFFMWEAPGWYTVDPGTMTKVNCRPSKQLIWCFQYFSFSSLAVSWRGQSILRYSAVRAGSKNQTIQSLNLGD